MADEIKDIKETEEEEIEEAEDGIVPGLRDTEIVGEVKSSFLDYAMSVIVARAIPDVRDGLKPVHRRIVFGMNEAGMTPSSPFKKCARIVGDVMGKYHPHGDSAIYQTLVRLAQPFAMRYTLVDGHGNFGSVDGDEAAAMRYTEARMTKIALEMVRDIDCNTVDFVDNYDGTEQEPSVLPSRIPNLLVNGSSGIAVGMATNMPTHNLGEVIDGIVALAENPEITPEEIMQNYVFGPDFPTGGIILGRAGIRDAYTKGSGSITIRSKCSIEESSSGKPYILVSEIPYGVNKATMCENIGNLAREKIIDGITGVRDETSNKGIRVIIELRRDVVPEVILNQLYKMTQLQTNFGVINLCLVDGAPKILNIKELLQYYLDFQVDVIERRTRFQLAKDEERAHVVRGLLIAHDNIDDVVEIIKNSETVEIATKQLMDKYALSEMQVAAILSMTLRRLCGMETAKLQDELKQLEENIIRYNFILSDRKNVVDVVTKELKEIKEKFSDDRLTDITDFAGNIDDEDLIPQQDIVVTITENGYIKRLTSDTFRAQNRGGRGIKGMSTNDKDNVEQMIYTKTHTDLLFFTNKGKVYRIRGYEVPEGNRQSKGIPVINLLNIEKDEKVQAILQADDYAEGHYFFFMTEGGVVKKTATTEFASIRQSGKIAISLREGDSLLSVKITDGNTTICLASSNGKLVSFNENDVRVMGRSAAGVKGIELSEGCKVVSATTTSEGEYILVVTEKGFGKMSHYSDYRLTKRGSKGVLTLKETDKTGKVIKASAVSLDQDLMIITNNGIVIRTPLDQVKIAGRNTQGVHVIRLEPRQKVSSFTVVPHEDVEETPLDENGNPIPQEEAPVTSEEPKKEE